MLIEILNEFSLSLCERVQVWGVCVFLMALCSNRLSFFYVNTAIRDHINRSDTHQALVVPSIQNAYQGTGSEPQVETTMKVVCKIPFTVENYPKAYPIRGACNGCRITTKVCR